MARILPIVIWVPVALIVVPFAAYQASRPVVPELTVPVPVPPPKQVPLMEKQPVKRLTPVWRVEVALLEIVLVELVPT